MDFTKSVKFLILGFSSFMFTYQMLVAIQKLMYPPVVDSTQRLKIKDIDNLLITVCPLNQWNTSKVMEFGYEDELYLLMGFSNESTFVGWGAQHNLSFDDIFVKVQTVKLLNPEINLLKKDFSYEKISYELRFYPKFGLCYELVNLTMTKNIVLETKMNTLEGENVKAQVFMTDKKLRTNHSVYAESHWGSNLIIEQGVEYDYKIKVELISNFDPLNPVGCKSYEVDEYDKCNVGKLQKIWKPLINCNPPWVSPLDQCSDDLIITNKTAELVYNASFITVSGIYEMVTYEAMETCATPCNVAQALIQQSEMKESRYAKEKNCTYLRLNFASEVVSTTKQLAYGSSAFLVDMGSSLGLWFGLSVFGITDLGIIALQYVKQLWISISISCRSK